jgi:hypothetical protein
MNSLLKITFEALRNVSLCPWKIGKIAAAALVLLHIDHDRTALITPLRDEVSSNLRRCRCCLVTCGPWTRHREPERLCAFTLTAPSSATGNG